VRCVSRGPKFEEGEGSDVPSSIDDSGRGDVVWNDSGCGIGEDGRVDGSKSCRTKGTNISAFDTQDVEMICGSYAAVELPEKLALTIDEAMDEAALATAEEREDACEVAALATAAELTEAPTDEAREAAEEIGLTVV